MILLVKFIGQNQEMIHEKEARDNHDFKVNPKISAPRLKDLIILSVLIGSIPVRFTRFVKTESKPNRNSSSSISSYELRRSVWRL